MIMRFEIVDDELKTVGCVAHELKTVGFTAHCQLINYIFIVSSYHIMSLVYIYIVSRCEQ